MFAEKHKVDFSFLPFLCSLCRKQKAVFGSEQEAT